MQPVIIVAEQAIHKPTMNFVVIIDDELKNDLFLKLMIHVAKLVFNCHIYKSMIRRHRMTAAVKDMDLESRSYYVNFVFQESIGIFMMRSYIFKGIKTK